jgi:hypothetical protein
MESAFAWGVLLFTFFCIERWHSIPYKRLTVLMIALSLIAAIGILYLATAKRSFVIPLFLLPLLWTHYLLRPISFRVGAMLGLLGALLATALLAVRIVAPLAARGFSEPWEYLGVTISEVVESYYQSTELGALELLSVVISDRDALLEHIGGTLNGIVTFNLEAFSFLVPRTIWPDKPPLLDISHFLFTWVTRGHDNAGIAVTAVGTFYLFGHLAGVAGGMLTVGYFYQRLYRHLVHRKPAPHHVFYYGVLFWLMFQAIRFGTLGFTFVFFVQTQVVGIIAFLVIRWLSWARYRPNPSQFSGSPAS